MVLSGSSGSIEPMAEVNGSVVDQGVLCETGYRERYVRALRYEPGKKTAAGAMFLGIPLACALFGALFST